MYWCNRSNGRRGCLLYTSLMKKEEVFAYAPHYDKLVANAEKIGFTPCRELKELVAKTDTLVMACKPYQIEGVLSEIKEELKGKALISIAAGWNYDKYQEFLDESTRLQFIMPNTPAMVGAVSYTHLGSISSTWLGAVRIRKSTEKGFSGKETCNICSFLAYICGNVFYTGNLLNCKGFEIYRNGMVIFCYVFWWRRCLSFCSTGIICGRRSN